MRSLFCLFLVAGCSGGNLNTSHSWSGPPPPPVKNAYFDPHGLPGSVPATWLAPAFDEHGTIVRPKDPAVDSRIPDCDHAPWIGGNGPGHPAGTF